VPPWLPGSADKLGEPGVAMARYEVSDELWTRIQPLLPVRPRRSRWPGRLPLDDRACLNGILFVLLTGMSWVDLPQQLGYGPGMTCWRRLCDWTEAGVWISCTRCCWPSSMRPIRSTGPGRPLTARMCARKGASVCQAAASRTASHMSPVLVRPQREFDHCMHRIGPRPGPVVRCPTRGAGRRPADRATAPTWP
jgi:transposase